MPKISLVEIKKLARERLPESSSVLKTLLDTPDSLEWNTENCAKVELFWELVVAAVHESGT
ncbi:MAG: hypothetical protein ABSG57_12075 [Candidatus Bathyarchaeia archaeon]